MHDEGSLSSVRETQGQNEQRLRNTGSGVVVVSFAAAGRFAKELDEINELLLRLRVICSDW